MFTSLSSNPTPISRDYNKKIFKIIQALLAYEFSNVFRKPIPFKSLGWEDYKDIIKKPIDLNFVRRQYNQGKYKSVEEVLDDLQLVWDNVFLYGKRQHETYDLAIKMQKYFDELLNDYLPQYYQKINRVLYFKQFQNTKTEKKSSITFNPDKNVKKTQKVQKMDIEPSKEEMKLQKEQQPSINNKKKQYISTRRQQTLLKTNNPPSAYTENIQNLKANNSVQEKIVQNKKTPSNTSSNKRIEIEEAPKNVENQKKIQTAVDSLKIKQTSKIKEQVSSKPNQAVIQNPPAVVPSSPIKLQTSQQAEPIQYEESQQNHFPPIMVNLNKTPSAEEVSEITKMMKLLFQLQEMESLSKIVKILTKYEKENMIIEGEEVNFRMNEIHISTYTKIRKELETKIEQLQQSEKVKDLDLLKEKYNIRLVNGFQNKFVEANYADSNNVQGTNN